MTNTRPLKGLTSSRAPRDEESAAAAAAAAAAAVRLTTVCVDMLRFSCSGSDRKWRMSTDGTTLWGFYTMKGNPVLLSGFDFP